MNQSAETDYLVPHAYAVETLWNRGGPRERWGMSMEMADVSHPLTFIEAEELRDEMIKDGHSDDAVRVVAMVVVA